ncbi:MAG: hypothetical protein DDT21_00124 [Syntrophomonadaceae bacterium]|nr:hypothetical protein [Bacillota bacterium]
MNRWPILVLFILLLILPDIGSSASPRDKRPALLVSQQGRVLMVIHHENGAENIAPIVARMEHDIHALEVIFRQLLDEGKLDDSYRTLVINAGFYGSTATRFSHAATRLYRTNHAVLSGWPLSLDEVARLRGAGLRRGEVLTLGRAYVIETSTGLLTLNDLLALIHLLPAPEQAQAVTEIRSEAELEAAASLIPPGLVENTSFGIGPPGVWSYVHVGGEFFRAIWQGGKVTYYLRAAKEKEEVPLPVLPYYLQRPVWGNRLPRFMAFANEETLTIIDRHHNNTFAVNLADLPGLADLTITELALAADSQQGRIAFSFREDNALGPAKSFSLDLQNGLVSPIDGDFFEHLRSIGLSEATWAWRQNRDAAWGQPLAEFLVRREVLTKRESEGLIFLPTFIYSYVPGDETVAIRLLAYSSREELVIKDLLAGKATSVDLRALRPLDYQAITEINLHFNTFGDEICFVLTGHGIKPAAYIWRAGAGLLGPAETVPTEVNPAGWGPMHRGTPDFTFRDIRLETGRAAALVPWRFGLSELSKAVYAFAIWSLLLVVCFGLPYVLAHLIAIKSALLLTKTGKTPVGAAVLSGILFIAISALSIFVVSNIFPVNIAGGDLPLPWGDPASMRAAWIMAFILILFVPATIVLALLNGRQAKALLCEIQGIADNVRRSERKWDFWGFSAKRHPPRGKWRYPLHCYATLTGCVLMVTYLFGFQLGFFLATEIVWLIFSLIVLIPYTAARPVSLLVAKSLAPKDNKP